MKLAASSKMLAFSKTRTGRRPISVNTLLRKEKDSSIFKLSAYGDTEPLWQDPNVGKIEYESKVPVKLNPRVSAPDIRKGDVPTNNVSGIGVRSEDGRSNAVTFSLGTQSTGDIVPDAMPSSYKLGAADAFADRFFKLAEMSDEEARSALEQLDAIEKSKLSPQQVARYSTIGAIAGPLVGLGRSAIQGGSRGNLIGGYFRDALKPSDYVRRVAGDAVAGAVTSGGIPILRSALDRQSAKSRVKQWVTENPDLGTVSAPPPMDAEMPLHKGAGMLSRLPTEHTEHIADLAGLGAMALGSGSHLYSQLKDKSEEGGPISPMAQSGLDLAGLGAMAAPTVAALSSLGKKAPGALAGGGNKWVNRANLAGLLALAVPTADKLQAHVRSAKGEDPEHKMLLGDKAHRALELAGYGTLAAPLIHNVAKGRGSWGDAAQLAGYATLAAPQVVPFEGPARTASELAGLGLLAAPTAVGMVGKH